MTENQQPTAEPVAEWALVEIFGHRRHYGRVVEVDRFGTKMMRVDVPIAPAAPLLDEPEKFETFFYGGGSIFSMTPMTEEAVRAWLASDRRGYSPMARLPAPSDDDDDDHF